MKHKTIKKKSLIINRPKEIQDEIRKLWSPTIVRTRFVLEHEINLFNQLYNELPVSPGNALDKIAIGSHRDFFEAWVKHRFTCLGTNWNVGAILIKDRTTTMGTWWFQNTSRCLANGSYSPTVLPYKLILIPLQVNNDKDSKDFAKITYYITNYHYVKNNISIFKHELDYYKSSKSNHHQATLDVLEKSNLKSEKSNWYEKYEFPKYTSYFDKLYLDEYWDIEIPYTWIPGSAIILDATRIYGYKDTIESINHKRVLSIMTYKEALTKA